MSYIKQLNVTMIKLECINRFLALFTQAWMQACIVNDSTKWGIKLTSDFATIVATGKQRRSWLLPMTMEAVSNF